MILRPYKKIKELEKSLLMIEEKLGHANGRARYWYRRWCGLYYWVDKKRRGGLFGFYDNIGPTAKDILGDRK